MKKIIIIGCLLVISAIVGAQQNATQKNTKFYLGQQSPEKTPVRFAKEVINDRFYPHSKIIISPDNKRIYWSSFIDTTSGKFALYYSDFDGEKLSLPRKDTLLSKYGIYSFIYSIDDNTIYFAEKYPASESGAEKEVYGIWYCRKEGLAWSSPQPVPNTIDTNWVALSSLSMSNNGDIYAVGRHKGSMPKIYTSKLMNGSYQKLEPLPEIINTGATLDPFIDSQGRYLIYGAAQKKDNIGIIDLYISFKKNNGDWSQPVNLGESINTKFMDRFPMITSDGKYFFWVTSYSNHFPGRYTHYRWVSAEIIEDFRNEALKEN